jgi:glycosyltransferase involved in cell wall biosynthesis
MIRRVHMIESLGRGGFFNHSVEVTAGLLDLGVDVTLHTASDPEAAPPGLDMCRCISWHRGSTSRFVRRSRTTFRYVTRTLPHLARVITADDVVHIQGTFALTPEVISVAKMRKATVVCSPHNTFVRDGAVGNGRVLASVLRRADRVLVYSDADAAALSSRLRNVGRVPLVQWTPPVDSARAASWRTSLARDGSRLAVMPGYVRADKNCDVFVRALAMMPGWRGAIVGEDMGGGPELNRLIEELGAPVTTQYRYLDVDEFVALVAASDVVAAPYRVASQSGVLSVAARLGVPRAAAPTGGLVELATAVARDISPESLRDAMTEAFEIGATPTDAVATDAARSFLEEYRIAHTASRTRVAAQGAHR